MGRVVEVAPEEAREAVEDAGAEFVKPKEDEEWRARHGGSVVAGHENGVVIYGGYEKIMDVIKGDEIGGIERKGEVTVYFDGASRGNPGEASVGYVLSNDGVIKKGSQTIGEATNNEAEYWALITGLKEARDLGYTEVEAVGDSQLIVKQVRGDWNCNSENLRGLYREVKDVIDEFDSFEIRHVPRESNSEADSLANKALDMEG